MKYIAFLLPLLLASYVSAAPPDLKPDIVGYRQHVTPLLTKYCYECHGDGADEGGLSLDKISAELATGEDLETWRLIREQLQFHDMPPEDAAQPTAAQRRTMLEWIDAELLKAQQPGALTDAKLLLPQFGNYVNHQALFDKRRSHVTPAPPRVWRLRPDIYDVVAPRLGENIRGLANALNTGDGPDFKDYAAPFFLDEASTLQLLGNAKMIAAAQLGPKSKDKVFKQLVEDEAPPADTVAEAIETAFRKALGRGPTPAEKQRFAAFYAASVKTAGHKPAAKALLTAVLMQPEFMFRQELGNGQPDQYGRVQLQTRELAYALSFALSDAPLREFTEAAASGKLNSQQQVADLVRQQLESSDPLSADHPRVLQFFREYFHYPFAAEVFKDNPEGGEHHPEGLISDLEMTVSKILKEDRQVLARLLTTNRYYVNTTYGRKKQAGKLIARNTKTRKYQTAFSLPLDWKWNATQQPVAFREDERAGVLTHPAWLAAWSGNFDNHPVQRGKWVRTHLLGGTVPDVPIGVDARVPEIPHTTFRNRLKKATAAAECWRCHRKMDPLGVVFEQYDHYGRVQRLDAGQPVDASGEVTRTPFPELHGKVTGPTQLMQRLATSERVEQVFVRHVFRYFLGRNETLGDANTLQDAHQAYRENNGSFKALLVAILSSDSFLLRQVEQR